MGESLDRGLREFLFGLGRLECPKIKAAWGLGGRDLPLDNFSLEILEDLEF